MAGEPLPRLSLLSPLSSMMESMPDRIDREIEEILSRLGDDDRRARGEGAPISLDARRRRRAPLSSRVAAAVGLPLNRRLTPASLLFTGAGVMVAGLILAAVWGTLIWLSFAGVLLFMAAFIWAFVRPRRTRQPDTTAKGAYWRGRYVEYEPASTGVLRRIRRALRRR